MPGELRQLGEIPIASTELFPSVVLELRGTQLTVVFEFNQDGTRRKSGVRFDGVRGHAQRAEGVSTAWHAEAYDTIVEVIDSAWREEIETLTYEQGFDPGELHHYMLYLDSEGCMK